MAGGDIGIGRINRMEFQGRIAALIQIKIADNVTWADFADQVEALFTKVHEGYVADLRKNVGELLEIVDKNTTVGNHESAQLGGNIVVAKVLARIDYLEASDEPKIAANMDPAVIDSTITILERGGSFFNQGKFYTRAGRSIGGVKQGSERPSDIVLTLTSIREITQNWEKFKNWVFRAALPALAFPKVTPNMDAPVGSEARKLAQLELNIERSRLVDFMAQDMPKMYRRKMECDCECENSLEHRYYKNFFGTRESQQRQGLEETDMLTLENGKVIDTYKTSGMPIAWSETHRLKDRRINPT